MVANGQWFFRVGVFGWILLALVIVVTGLAFAYLAVELTKLALGVHVKTGDGFASNPDFAGPSRGSVPGLSRQSFSLHRRP